MRVAWNHQLGTLAVVRSVAHYLRHPLLAYRQDRVEWRRFWAYRKAIAAGLARYYEGYPRTSIAPDFLDLWRLYDLVLKIKPKIIMELGGGCSTIAFSHALTRTGGTLHAVDESAYWQSVLLDFMPDELKSTCRFHVSDIGEQNGISFFTDLPDIRPDLLYIDGGLVKGSPAGGDALDLEHEGMHIVIDGRKGTVDYLAANLKHRYEISRAAGQTIFRPL